MCLYYSTVLQFPCRVDESNVIASSIEKPGPRDAICSKEKHIHAKVLAKIIYFRTKSMEPVSFPFQGFTNLLYYQLCM